LGDIADVYGGTPVDTNRGDAATGFEPIPAGWWPTCIDRAEIQKTKSGNGMVLLLELTIVGDHHCGRKIWPRINIQNPNTQAMDIGMRELAALGQACGHEMLSDTSELTGKTIESRLVVRPARDGYPAENSVRSYRPVGAGTAATHKAVTQQRHEAAPVSAQKAAKRPWEK